MVNGQIFGNIMNDFIIHNVCHTGSRRTMRQQVELYLKGYMEYIQKTADELVKS